MSFFKDFPNLLKLTLDNTVKQNQVYCKMTRLNLVQAGNYKIVKTLSKILLIVTQTRR